LNLAYQVDNIPTALSNNYTVVESFDHPQGKFGDTFGNVILIDCRYAKNLISSTFERFFR